MVSSNSLHCLMIYIISYYKRCLSLINIKSPITFIFLPFYNTRRYVMYKIFVSLRKPLNCFESKEFEKLKASNKKLFVEHLSHDLVWTITWGICKQKQSCCRLHSQIFTCKLSWLSPKTETLSRTKWTKQVVKIHVF